MKHLQKNLARKGTTMIVVRLALFSLVAALVLLLCVDRRVYAQSAYSVLHQFDSGAVATDGAVPHSSLLLAPDGNYYGTTQLGGTTAASGGNGGGTVFRMSPSGAVTVLHNFGDGSISNDGLYPSSGLTLGADGNLYGTTLCSSDPNGEGTVFKMTLSGTLSIIYEFGSNNANDGKNPSSTLLVGLDGNFYGTTMDGGTGSGGTLFRLTPAGSETILHNFSDSSVAQDGATPVALTSASDGTLVGVTNIGGSGNSGTVFSYSTSDQYSILHNFQDGSVFNDGSLPNGLMLGTDGNYYGTTSSGGLLPNGNGTVYQITPTGTVDILYCFGQLTDGFTGQPQAGLLQASDGNFYGETPGTVYCISPTGTFSEIYLFGLLSSIEGYFPQSPLIQGADGCLYGTSAEGGVFSFLTSGSGNLFRLSLGLPIPAIRPRITSLTTSGTSSTISWSAMPGAISYTLNRGTLVNGQIVGIQYPNISSTKFTDVGLSNGGSYSYTVQAVYASSTSALSNMVVATIAPSAPPNLHYTINANNFTLSWTGSPGAVTYNAYIGSSLGYSNWSGVTTGITSTSVTFNSIPAGQTKYCFVRALNPGGVGPQSTEIAVISGPPTPSVLSATASNGQVSLSWTATPTATSYNTYFGPAAGVQNATSIHTGLTGTTATYTGLINGTTYYFTLRAITPAGVIQSNQATATPEAS